MTRTLFLTVALAALAVPDAAAQSLAKGFDPATDWGRFPKLFEPSNTSAGRKARYAPDGLLFEISPNTPGNVMFIGETRIPGDFQAEVSYQIDALPDKAVGGGGRYGAMLGLRAVVDATEGDAAMNRGVYERDGHSYHAGRMIPLGAKPHYASRGVPTTSRHGRMGLRRAGDRVLCLASDTPTGPLRLVTEYPFPAGRAVSRIVLYADGGGQPTAVTGRLYDFRLRTGDATPTDTPPPGPPATEFDPLPTQKAVAAAKAAPMPSAPTPTASVSTADPTAAEGPTPAPVRGNWWLPVVTLVVGLVAGVVIGRKWKSPPREAV